MPPTLRTRALLILVNLVRRKPNSQRTISDFRRTLDRLVGKPKKDPTPAGAIRDLTIPGPDGSLPVRLYSPESKGPHPLLMFFHGGGFVWGNLDAGDRTCRTLCANAECAVLSVDYRLAPESKFPAAVDDCYAATRWAASNAAALGIDATRIAVAGDSAGGAMAAVTALCARDAGEIGICGQLLIYPVTDHYSSNHPSMLLNGKGYGLTSDMMIWFWDEYLESQAHVDDPRVSPLRAASVAGLPPALVISAEFDPLRDEGERYAERLRHAGSAVACTRYTGMIHGFVHLQGLLPEARLAIREASEWLKQQFRLTGRTAAEPINVGDTGA